MSKINLKSPMGGIGSVTITSTDTDSDFELKLPLRNGTLATTDQIGDTSTFATKTELTQGLAGKLDINGKANSATVADSANSVLGTNVSGAVALATKATQDSSGNDIASTYATKTENNGKISLSGSRGTLAGSETATALSGNQTITKDSADTIVMNTTGSITLTFTPAGTTECAVKVIALTATGTTTVAYSGGVWANGGEAPTWGTTGKHLVLVANFIGGRVILNVFDNDEG